MDHRQHGEEFKEFVYTQTLSMQSRIHLGPSDSVTLFWGTTLHDYSFKQAPAMLYPSVSNRG